MKLSSALVVNRLTGQFLFDFKGKINNDMVLSRPQNVVGNMLYQDGLIYVGAIRKNDKAPNFAIRSMLITQGHILESVKDRFDCILILDEKEDISAVANRLHSIFDLYDSWYQDLMEMSLAGAPLSDFLERSQNIFINPLKVHNKDFKFIAYSSIIDTNPSLRFLLEDSTPQDILNDYMLHAEYRATYDRKSADVFPPQITGHRTAFYNVNNHEHYLCRILVIETLRGLEPSDLYFLEILGKQIEHVLTREQDLEYTPVRTLNNLLFQILSGEHVDDYEMMKVFRSYGWLPENHYFCFKLVIDKIDLQNHAFVGMVERLEKQMPGSCALKFENDIALFVNLELSGRTADDSVTAMKEYIRDHNIRAGISEVYTGFVEIFQLLYKQASIALDMGLRYLPYQWIHTYQDNIKNYLVECCTRDLPAQMVIRPEIRAIHEYDQQHPGSEFLHTLKVYLANNMQPVSTSRELFIHRTTFLYRIDKLIQRFRLDLENPQMRLIYELSILLLERA